VLPFIGASRSGDDERDAGQVGDAVLELVKGLGLATDLKSYKVGEDQVAIITQRATGQEGGEVFDRVAELVRGLY
jgi:hypothetical protein